MKFLVAALAFAAMVCIVITQKDPGQVAVDCKTKYPITKAEEDDIMNKTFLSNSTNAKSFYDCFITTTGFADSQRNLNRTAFVSTTNDTATIAKMDTCLKSCTSKATDLKQKVWELSACYFKGMSS